MSIREQAEAEGINTKGLDELVKQLVEADGGLNVLKENMALPGVREAVVASTRWLAESDGDTPFFQWATQNNVCSPSEAVHWAQGLDLLTSILIPLAAAMALEESTTTELVH